MNRRNFLISAAAAGTAQSRAASDRIRVAVIGMGGRGGDLMHEAVKLPGVEVAAISDPDELRMAQGAADLAGKTGRQPKQEADFRRILEDKTIDAVMIATCNHWHAVAAIWACRAGKHVYVEKPVSHNIREGQILVEAARKYDRIVQGGTQRRSQGYIRKAVELIHQGLIGDIYLSHWKMIGPRESIGFKEPETPPAGFNWDLWLGPAPEQPFHRNLVHYNWHWFWDFGNGEMGNNGIHIVDIARWAMNKELPVRVSSAGGRFGYKDQAQTPNTQTATWIFADGSHMVGEVRNLYTREDTGWQFFGTKGYMEMDIRGGYKVWLGRNKQPEPDMGKLEEINHYANFFDAIRAGDRKLLRAEINETHLSTAFCHLANIAYRLGRELKFDPVALQFPGDSEANGLLTREYRKPYTI